MKVGEMQITEEHLRRIRIPKCHWRAELNRIPESCRHKSTIVRYCDDILNKIWEPTGLLLFGEYSSGKSAIGAICLKAAAAQGVIGYWISAGDLPRYQIEKEMFDDELTCYERAKTSSLLVIDEYYMRAEMKWTEDAVDALVRARIDEEKCTIITTNHTPQDIERNRPAMGAALHQATYPIKVLGHDFRKDIGKEMNI